MMSRFWPRRRTLRLGSGLVLFAYVAGHLLNHALGLVSLSAAERGLALAVWFWHSRAATFLLYGSAAIHVALAFYALYERRSLRLPAIEWLRIVLGFGMPILLIGHVVATRAAFEVYAMAPEYGRVIHGLWSSGNEWLQLGLLAPGWIHGCLGLHIALGHRRFYRRTFLVWFSFALILPILSGLGFLMMSKEVIAAPAVQKQAQAGVNPGEGIGSLRQSALSIYLLLFALLLAARTVRGLMEKRQRSLVRIKLAHRSFSMPKGWTVLEGLRSNGIAHVSVCGGRGRCSTCRIRVDAGLSDCPSPVGVERELLGRTGDPAEVRLACQLRPFGDLAIVPMFPAGRRQSTVELAAQRRSAASLTPPEQESLLLLISLQSQAGLSAGALLPDDAWYVLQQLLASVQAQLPPARASIAECAADYLIVRFEGSTSTSLIAPTASKSSAIQRADRLACIERIEQALQALELRLGSELGLPSSGCIYIHQGVVRLGEPVLRDNRPGLVIGESANVLRLAAQNRFDKVGRLQVSGKALDALGLSGTQSMAGLETRFFACQSIRHPASELSAVDGL
jgi:adenylate cyclase